MSTTNIFEQFTEVTHQNFEQHALALFRFQYQQNPLYQAYCQSLHISPTRVNSLKDIPFLPISFFKTHTLKTGNYREAFYFESSGTTASLNSKHYIKHPSIYEISFQKAFEQFFGLPNQYCIIGLLPSYLERKNASLVYMVKELINQSAQQQSGFYLNDFEKLHQTILSNEKNAIKTILIGVSFALMDFAEKYPMALKHCQVIETGGMKGKRKELTREQLHQFLKEKWQLPHIISEYGMTELLSQAYALREGKFYTPSWLKVLVRAQDDPLETLSVTDKAKNGALNIIDLANIYSVAFIATEDVGRLQPDGSFEVFGRMDVADIRGCSLMVP